MLPTFDLTMFSKLLKLTFKSREIDLNRGQLTSTKGLADLADAAGAARAVEVVSRAPHHLFVRGGIPSAFFEPLVQFVNF